MKKIIKFFKKRILSCKIIDKNENSIDCNNIFKLSLKINEWGFYIKQNLVITPLQQKINFSNIMKIIIMLNVENCFTKTLMIRENEQGKYILIFNNGTEMNIIFQKILLLKSPSSLGDTCLSMQENKSYNNYDCQMKFVNNHFIHHLKLYCILRDPKYEFYVDDLKLLGNKFCERNQTLKQYFTKDNLKLMAKTCPKGSFRRD